jgi:FKBP-type peptidyl-prolyl cis-trans isomerase 2
MALEKGALIFAEYTSKVKDTGEAIETTKEDEAKKLNIYDSTRRYEPRLIAVGEGWMISGLDAEIKKLDVGEKKEIELSPTKAFGERDPTQLRMVPLRKFGEKASEMSVGDTVEVDNRVGIVRFIGSGRAQIDFNHRLAGKSIVYDFQVVKRLETDDEKIRALIDRRFAGEGSKVTPSLKESDLEIRIPEELFLLEGLQIIKRGISTDIFKFIPAVSSVVFVEQYNSKKPEQGEKGKEAGAAGEAAPAAAVVANEEAAKPTQEESKPEKAAKKKSEAVEAKKEQQQKKEKVAEAETPTTVSQNG